MLLRILPRFRAAYRMLPILEKRESWTRTEIEAYQLQALNAVWTHARDQVPHYRKYAGLSTPSRFASLDEYFNCVPILSRQTVRQNPKELLSDRPAKGHWTRTGGSTGTPTDVYWGNDADLIMLRGRYRFLASWGIDLFDRSAFLWGHSSSFKPGWKGWLARRRQPLEDGLRNRLRLSAYHLGQPDLQRYLGQINAFRPVFLYGYSSAMALLAEEAQHLGFSSPSLKLAVLTGEPAFVHFVERIEQKLKIPTAIEYGSVECGFLAGEAPDRTLRVREDHVILETLPAEDGKYQIVVSVLTNPSFPLLRYDIGDLTDEPLQKPQRGFAVLKNVCGRNNDLIYSRSGERMHSARFDALFKYEVKGVRRFRMQQQANGAVRLLLELESSAPEDIACVARDKIRELLSGYPVQVELVEEIPLTVAGKHRLVESAMYQAVPTPDYAA